MSAFLPSDLSYPYNSSLPNRTPLPWFLRTAFSSLAQCIVFLSIPYLLSTFSTFLVSADNGLPTPPYTCHRDGRLDSPTQPISFSRRRINLVKARWKTSTCKLIMLSPQAFREFSNCLQWQSHQKDLHRRRSNRKSRRHASRAAS